MKNWLVSLALVAAWGPALSEGAPPPGPCQEVVIARLLREKPNEPTQYIEVYGNEFILPGSNVGHTVDPTGWVPYLSIQGLISRDVYPLKPGMTMSVDIWQYMLDPETNKKVKFTFFALCPPDNPSPTYHGCAVQWNFSKGRIRTLDQWDRPATTAATIRAAATNSVVAAWAARSMSPTSRPPAMC